MKKLAVILAGCGNIDGSEIRESVLSLLALDSLDTKYDIFSLDEDQYHVVDYLSGDTRANEKRNMLAESARIARANIRDLASINVADYAGLLIPGGFGVAKNFCNFAFAGIDATVHPSIARVITTFHTHKKPIGAICISPVLIALVLGKYKPLITLGTNTDLARNIEKTGACHRMCAVQDCVVDKENKIVSTPAYMDGDLNLADAYEGIRKLVAAIIDLS